ncbi:MAG: S41 family peptidase [Nitriliruptorales bacterium]|nr:S41 family peptidase [Nitriliruptorales bacterium]
MNVARRLAPVGRILLWALLASVLIAGCSVAGSSDGTATSPPATAAPTSPSSTPTPSPSFDLSYETADCVEPPDAFELICEITDLIRTEYVDPPQLSALAEAAANGVEPSGGSPAEGFTCALPADAFRALCDAFALAGGPGDATIEAAIRGMVRGTLDPNSGYQDPAEYAQAREDQSGQVEGIGALVTTEDRASDDPEGTRCQEFSDTCRLVIVAVFDGAPADRVGLQQGDVIVSVDGDDIAGQDIDEVVADVRGPAGTDVELGILRDGEVRQVTITRAAVDIPVTESEMVGDTAYLRLTLFTNDSDERFRSALRDLTAEDPRALVLDLRSNPGGALDAAVNIASEFLSGGLVLRTESPEGDREYRVQEGGLATDPSLEVVVLVNRGSASASEVVAAALREAGRATIVGQRTFGKDTVQQTFPLDNGGALKLTIAQWVTPDGDGFGEGLRPDVELTIPDDATPGEIVAAVHNARQN